MKKIIIIIVALLLTASKVFADDVSIDSSGNVKTGVSNANAELEVTGGSGEGGIRGMTSGTGASGVYGINTTYGDYGILGYYGYGVFGYSSGGYAGYFQGNALVTGNLTVNGNVSGPNIGDITAVNAGTGLTGGATSGAVTLSADTNYLQRRVSSSCTVGSSIRAINADGTVECQTDNAGITAEDDPEVGSNTSDFVPKWNGTGLVTGTIFDNGNIGIGTTSPSQKLTVAGTIESTSGGIKFPDGTVQTSARYRGIAVVAKSGGDYEDPVIAMGDLGTWCGTPAPNNPCLLKIMPGVYDIGTNTLEIQSYISVEGSGENDTKITGSIDGYLGTVHAYSDSEIRFITVKNYGGGAMAKAINSGTAKILHVTAIASGAIDNYGIYCGAYCSATMINVTASASGGSNSYGVYYYFRGGPTMTNVTVSASGGDNNYVIYNDEKDLSMTNVIVTAFNSGSGGNNYGIYNTERDLSMTNVTVRVSGGSRNYGIFNTGSYLLTAAASLIIASGGTFDNYGVYNENSGKLAIQNSTISASDGSNSFGVLNVNTGGDVTIDRSTIVGATISARNYSTSSYFVGASKLVGDVDGSVTCAGVYDGNYTFYTGTCP